MKNSINSRFLENSQKLFEKENRSNKIRLLLANIDRGDNLILFLYRYISFNSISAGCVSNLAGNAHILEKTFYRNSNRTNFLINGKASEITSYIFAAAEDEYNARRRNDRTTRREMARFFLERVQTFFKSSYDFYPDSIILGLNKRVKKGYTAVGKIDDYKIFKGIGFHIASEELADQEFSEIDKFLCSKFPGLVEHLKSTKHSSGLNAYYWVKSHCIVKKDHHDFALKALEIALENYSGQLGQQEIENASIQGFSSFCDIQDELFEHCVNFDYEKDAFNDYIDNVLAPANKNFGDMPVCPFASKEKKDGKIKYLKANFDTSDNEIIIKSILAEKEHIYKHTLLIYDTACGFTITELRNYGTLLSEELKEHKIIAIGLHPNDDFQINDFETRQVPFHTLLVQSVDEVNQTRSILSKTEYYKNWSKEDKNFNENQFGRFL